MEPLAFLPAHVRQLVLSDSQDHQLPQSVEDDGFVAIIDISGYSKLSSRLESLLGNEAGATIKDLINPPMEIIIKSVNHHKGSVVKLAGDAVIASWSLHTGAAEFGRESMTLQYQLLGSDVLLCCLKLLEAFRDYTISFEVKQGSSFDENVFNKHPHNSKDNARSPDRSGKPAPWFKSAASKFGLHANEKISQPLKIHIGIGIGRFNHIHIGNKMKREYFIAGPSLEQSGICLNLGKQGDLVFTLDFQRIIQAFLNEFAATELEKTYFVVSESNETSTWRMKIESFQKENGATNSEALNQGENEISITSLAGHLPRVATYLDDTLSNNLRLSNKITLPDQLRKVSVVFIKLCGFSSETLAESGDLAKLQNAMTVVCKAVRSFEGCIRQFNCDDKALTALLVWGLEGMSHEKGEMGLALSAAFEIAQSFPPILNNEFAIGVTSGTAFSGVVGTKTRCDATILGVAVNNAARLMSLEICHGSVLCDHETFKHTDEMFEFDVNIPLVGLKGVERPVKIYRPTQRQNLNMLNERKSLRRELFGREKEIRELELILSNWRAHWMEQRVINCLIVGQSGIGKSEILVWLHHAIDAKTEILCIARAQEHKQESVLFSWTQIFYSFLMQLAKNPCFLTALKSTPSETHPSLKRGRRGTIFTDVSKPSNAVNEGGEPRSDTDEKAKLKTVLISLLQSLNFPFSYIEHLNYLCGLSNSSSFSNGVSSLQLGVIVSRIFNAIHDSGVNVAISLDDIQWCDPASLELAQVLLAKCPNVLFSFAARPVEEWRPELAKYFTYISTAPLFKTMRLNALSALNIDAMLRKAIKLPVKLIDQSLITGILIRSQGVPMVAQLLIYSLAEDHRETIAAGLPVSLITTAMNATTAVVAQFDKLSPKLKSLLRVAAVSGQVFKLEDVGAVLELLETSKSVSPTVKKNSFKHSNDALLSLIINYDKFQFITAKETHGDLSFAHYLIQQGILSTIVPKEREQLHRLFFEYYEYLLEVFSTHTLETSEFTSIRQTMIHHLLSFPSESRKKKQIIYDAFIEAAEMNQTNLSFNYLSILEQLPAQVDLTDTIYKKIRECRLLTQLHFEQGQYKAAISFVSRGLRFMGCQQKYGSSNPLTIMPTVLSMCKQIKTMILLGDTERRKFAVKHIKKVFPRILESKNAEFSSDEVQETLKQLAQLLYLGASSYEHSRPGLELLQLTLMAAYPICLITTDRPHRLCWYFSSLSIATGTLGFSELSRLCKDLSDTVSNQAGLNTEEVLDIMSSFQIGLIVVLKEMTSYTLVLEGKFEESARTLKEGIDLLADEGLQLSEKANYLTAFAWSSTLNALMRQHEYYSFFEREEHSYQSAGLGKYALCEIHMTAASTLCAMNLVSRAKEIYLQHVQMTRSSPSEFLESNRRIHILTNALRVCVAVIRVSNGRETLDMEGHLVLCFHTFSSNLLRMFNIRACLTYLPLFIELGLHNIQQKILCEDTFTAIGVKGSKCVSLVRKILRFIQTEIIFPHYPGITYKKKLAGAAAILWASGTSLSNLKKTLEGFVKCCRALLKNLYSKGTEFDPPAAHKCLIRTRIWYAEGLLLLVMRVGGRTVVAGSSKELKWREQGQQLKRDLETSSWTVDWELYLIECAFQKCVSCV